MPRMSRQTEHHCSQPSSTPKPSSSTDIKFPSGKHQCSPLFPTPKPNNSTDIKYPPANHHSPNTYHSSEYYHCLPPFADFVPNDSTDVKYPYKNHQCLSPLPGFVWNRPADIKCSPEPYRPSPLPESKPNKPIDVKCELENHQCLPIFPSFAWDNSTDVKLKILANSLRDELVPINLDKFEALEKLNDSDYLYVYNSETAEAKKFAAGSFINSIDLTNYATKEYVDAAIANITIDTIDGGEIV